MPRETAFDRWLTTEPEPIVFDEIDPPCTRCGQSFDAHLEVIVGDGEGITFDCPPTRLCDAEALAEAALEERFYRQENPDG